MRSMSVPLVLRKCLSRKSDKVPRGSNHGMQREEEIKFVQGCFSVLFVPVEAFLTVHLLVGRRVSRSTSS